jgi:plasmid stability protein
MSQLQPTTIYLEPGVRRALKVKAAATDQSMSALVNDAVRHSLRASLREDARDLAIARRRLRRKAKGIPYEVFIEQLKKEGRL